MAVQNLNPLGTVACGECGQSATVHQAKRGKGKFLYTRCPECKADQRTGKTFQTRLWNETVWNDGKKPENPPSNVVESDWAPDDKNKVEPTAKLTADSVDEPVTKKTGKGAWFAGFAVLLTGLGALLFMVRNKQQPDAQPKGEFYGF